MKIKQSKLFHGFLKRNIYLDADDFGEEGFYIF